jgi:hypothetical protein
MEYFAGFRIDRFRKTPVQIPCTFRAIVTVLYYLFLGIFEKDIGIRFHMNETSGFQDLLIAFDEQRG